MTGLLMTWDRVHRASPVSLCHASCSSSAPPDPSVPAQSSSPMKIASLRSQVQPVDMWMATPNAVDTAAASSYGRNPSPTLGASVR